MMTRPVRERRMPRVAAKAMANTLDGAADKDLPDVVLAPSDQLAEWQQARQLLVDLNQYLPLDSWGMPQAEREGYLPVYWKQDQFDPGHRGGPLENHLQGRHHLDRWQYRHRQGRLCGVLHAPHGTLYRRRSPWHRREHG